jgi:hypothetical protein
MTTARGIITKALQKIGALTKSESPSADEINDGLDSLNMLIASWANESLMIYARAWETFTLVGNQELYTMGPGGDFNTSRPLFINEAFYRIGTTDYQLSVVSQDVYFGNIIQKELNGMPMYICNDNAFPAVNLRLWPVPAGAYELHLMTEKALTSLTIDTTINLPPGWERALVYNLAGEIAPEYGQQPDQSVFKIAADSKKALKLQIARNTTTDQLPVTAMPFNIYRGY